jgi:branched-subunit amino acid ABC-type transport system permease component
MLFAVAFSLVLKVVRFWNLAQSGLMGLAFYGMYAARSWMQLPLAVSVLVGLALTIAAILSIEFYGLRTLRARNSLSLTFFIFALVVSEFLTYLLQIIFGTEPLTVGDPGASAVDTVLGIVVTHWDIQAIIITAVLLALLHLFIRKTRDGRFLAAVADNPDLSRLYGIDVKRAYVITFVLASILITAGMYLFGTRASILPNTSFHLMGFFR